MVLRRIVRFAWRVLKRFHAKKGLLLAGGVGYNALLSTVPLVAVTLMGLSLVVEQQELVHVVDTQFEVLLPGSGHAFANAATSFMTAGAVAGGLGIGVLLFFSAVAFRVLEDAIAIIFERRVRRRRARHALVSGLISVSYVVGVVSGLLLLTVATRLVEKASAGTTALLVRGLAFVGTVILMGSFYRVLPVATVSMRHALVGGGVATVLLELVRYVLLWYFSHISLVGLIYGPFATVVVVLLSFEVSAIIVLLGAQVIAEIDRATDAGLHWHEEPPASELFGQGAR